MLSVSAKLKPKTQKLISVSFERKKNFGQKIDFGREFLFPLLFMFGAPNKQRFNHFPDPGSHYVAPGGHFGFCRQCGIAGGARWANAPGPLGLYFPSKVVFPQRKFLIKSPVLSKFVFYQMSAFIARHLPYKVAINKIVFHQRSPSIEGRFPSKVASMGS